MKKIVISLTIIVAVVLGIIIVRKKIAKNSVENVFIEENTDELEWMKESRKAKEEYNKVFYISEEDIFEITMPSPEWNKIDLPDDKKDKLKSKFPNGIFDGEEYENVYIEEGYKSLTSNYNDPPMEFNIIATKGLKKDRYKVIGVDVYCFLAKENFEIERVDKFTISNEDGVKINSGYPMDEEHWLSNLYLLSCNDNDEVGKSENFYNNYPNFFGMLIPYPYDNISIVEVKWIKDKNDYNNKTAYCEVFNPYRSENYEYCIKFTTDDNNYIDTYIVEEIKKDEHYYESDNFDEPLNQETKMRLIYKNRNWGKLPLTGNFLNKFNSEHSIFPNYEIIYYKGINFNKSIGNKSALELTLDDFSKKYVGLIYKIVNNKIDDIEIHYLPDIDYSNMSKEEIYNMF